MDYKNSLWVFHADVPAVENAGVARRVLAYTDALMCVENTFEAGAVGATHSHPHVQAAYIVSGVFVFTIAGETRRVCAGDSLLMLGDVPHGCACVEPGVVLDVFTPHRADFL